MPDDTKKPDFSDLRVRPGGMMDAYEKSQLPEEGHPVYDTPLGQAYGKMKDFLSQHEQHFSDSVLKPFRQGLDNMASDLSDAAESGHTKSGGALNPVTRALAGATSKLLGAVPVGKDVKDTIQASIVPPEFGPEVRGLSRELKAAESGTFQGLRVQAAEPTHAYRARPVGQEGVPAGARPVATSSLSSAEKYADNLESMTGKKHEVIQVPLKDTKHTVHPGPNENEHWYQFHEEVPETSVKKRPGSQSESKPSPKDMIEKEGFKYKGELSPGSGVHMMEHPDHPGKTAAMKENQITPEAVRTKMKDKLKEFEAVDEAKKYLAKQ